MRQTTIIVVAAATKQVVVHQRLQRVQRRQRPRDLQPLSEIPENQSVIVGNLAIAGPLMPLMNADAADQRAIESCVRPPSSLSPPTKQLLFISGFSVFSGFSGLAISKSLSEIPENQSVIVGNLTIAGPLIPLMGADAADQTAMESCVRPPSSLSPPRQTNCCSSAASACSAASAASRFPNLSEIPENQSVIVGHLAIGGPLMPLMGADAADQRAAESCA